MHRGEFTEHCSNAVVRQNYSATYHCITEVWCELFKTFCRKINFPTLCFSLSLIFFRRKKLNEVERIISNRRLSILLYVHLGPINVVVFYDPSGKSHLGVGFVLRCFQRLSFPDTATLRCYWRNNRHTVGPVNSVLSY